MFTRAHHRALVHNLTCCFIKIKFNNTFTCPPPWLKVILMTRILDFPFQSQPNKLSWLRFVIFLGLCTKMPRHCLMLDRDCCRPLFLSSFLLPSLPPLFLSSPPLLLSSSLPPFLISFLSSSLTFFLLHILPLSFLLSFLSSAFLPYLRNCYN
jgi:hypothetical protein